MVREGPHACKAKMAQVPDSELCVRSSLTPFTIISVCRHIDMYIACSWERRTCRSSSALYVRSGSKEPPSKDPPTGGPLHATALLLSWQTYRGPFAGVGKLEDSGNESLKDLSGIILLRCGFDL